MKDLTKELQGKWHHVYFDNFFLHHTAYSVIWKRVGSMGVGQPERITWFSREPQEGKI